MRETHRRATEQAGRRYGSARFTYELRPATSTSENSVMAKFAEWMLCDVREREDVEALSSLYGTPSLSARQAYCRAPPLSRSPSHPAPLPSSDVPALRRFSPLPG